MAHKRILFHSPAREKILCGTSSPGRCRSSNSRVQMLCQAAEKTGENAKGKDASRQCIVIDRGKDDRNTGGINARAWRI